MTHELSSKQVVSALSGLTISGMVASAKGWVVEANGRASAICPGCATPTDSRHSRYRRRLQDLPLQGISVTLEVRLSRWRCRNSSCQRRIFAERLSDAPAPYTRQTRRLAETRMLVGRALGGRPGVRLARRLGLPVSRDTLLRQVKAAAREPVSSQGLRVLGVDDWAWKKGASLGTVSLRSLLRRTERQ
jgi:transposase